ncbi:NAD-dependent epimerase/dehydratase family protein [Candidatus Cardinium hertigii]|jgi:UDP-glucose 4-epimerase|uniref:NAD-dependent epimerase/dehydratase family protein n=1 Tax=Candidatus Cardinium hertigii TaxID=247481 RepID=A0A3N2QCN4_9BACT|nr:NAD-dependent epimerase/dehydratase family protein [Candidatus Cardinium hertigii]ROT47555.1 NAD-dependent epimerase/dehydratase family protein [Candidatus Cardinium hertigii]
MKIFITGVAGFLGSHLAERMLQLGYDVVGVDNLDGGTKENLPKEVVFYEADCFDLDKMTKYMRGCELVYHAAASPYDGLSVFSPMYVTRNTFQISVSVLSAAIRNNVKRFVYCSSMARYGDLKEIPFREDMVCIPENPYGIAKLAAEETIKALAKVHGMEYVILVPHNIIGPKQCYQDPYRNVAAIMINRILQGKPLIIYNDGTQKRCFSFIEDVVHCFEKALLIPDVNGEVINVGPDEEFITINTLGKTICRLMHVDFNPTYADDRPLEVKYATCSSEKARRLLDYNTKKNLEDGLKSIIDYIENKGPRPFKYNRPLEIRNKLTPKTWSEKLM